MTKNLNWEILTKNFDAFEDGMGLRMKNFNAGVHWKIRFIEWAHEKPI